MPDVKSNNNGKPSRALNVGTVFEIVLKRRWLVIVPFMLAMIAGIYLALVLPKVYQASTLILIQPQKVPTNYIQSVVSADINSRLDTISQQILSRTNLEKIIKQFNLYSDPVSQNMYVEDKIQQLRRQITVEVTRGSRRRPDAPDAFSISFKGKDPVKVMNITNTLGSFFIDENLKTREAQALGTSDFLEEELLSLRKHLETLEEKIKNYRERNMGALPEQLETNLRILDRLQTQISSKQEALIDAKNRLVGLEKQIADQEKLAAQSLEAKESGVLSDSAKLNQMQEQLLNLKAKYTDRHPDVIRLVKEIKELKAAIAADQIKITQTPAVRINSPRLQMEAREAEQKKLQIQNRQELKEKSPV